MTDAPELKPCPFCGGAVSLVKGAVAFDDYEVACDECGFSGPNFGALGHEPYPKEDAINHWNTRATHKVKPLVWLGGGDRYHSDGGEFVIYRLESKRRNVFRLIQADFGTTYRGDFGGKDAIHRAMQVASTINERRILGALE